MSTEIKARYRYIDYYKALAIILVILGHINFANEHIKPWIYAFHMPAFFFVSGLVLKDQQECDLKDCLRLICRKAQMIIIPYFVWALIYSSFDPNNVIKIIYGSHIMLKSAGSLTSLWFLPTLFLCFVFYEIFRLIFRNRFGLLVKNVLMILTFAIAAIIPSLKRGYPWNLNVAFYAFGFLLLGNILFPMVNKIRDRIINSRSWKGVCICITAVLFTFVGTLLYQFNMPSNSPVINTARAIYGNYFIFLPIAMIGILFILFLSILLEYIIPKTKKDFLSFVGQNTICIFVIHKPIAQKLFGKLFSIIPVPNFIAVIVTCIGTLLISCLITLFINRYLPCMIGKIPKGKDPVEQTDNKEDKLITA